ncbi:MAG: branched-chain-amino-acid transaminase [Rhodospirillales bacterium]
MTVSSKMIVNGSLVPFEQATVHLMSAAMRYGLNVFEGLRGYWNPDERELYVFRLPEHLERLAQSMKLMRFAPEVRVEEVGAAILTLLRENGLKENCHIRATAYLAGLDEHHVPGPVSWMVYAGSRARSPKCESGIAAQISSWRRLSDNALPPRVKCGANYANARLARFQARTDGYDDAIMLNESGKVGEGPGACLFLLRRDRLITPDLTSGILESVTRDTLLTLAAAAGLAIEERAVDRSELYAADELFLAGSAAEVLPVVSLDGLEIGKGGVGPVTRRLQAAYFAAVTGEACRAQGWLTPVYGSAA